MAYAPPYIILSLLFPLRGSLMPGLFTDTIYPPLSLPCTHSPPLV